MDHEDSGLQTPLDTNLGISRRTLLRRGAVVGGSLVWAAPAVQSISRAALAQTNGTPPRQPEVCCTADAYALRVIIPPLGIDQTLVPADGSLANTGTIGQAGVATVRAQVLNASRSTPRGGPCAAQASLTNLNVVVGRQAEPRLTLRASVIESRATAHCAPDCRVFGTASIADLNVNNQNVNVSAQCNFDVLGLGLVIFNRQMCVNGTLNVDALYINVPDVLELVVAHSQAQAAGCPCQPCATP